jgi:hypothetical protein
MFTKEDMKKAWLVQEFMEEAKLEGKAEGVQDAVATELTLERVQKLVR